MKCTIFTISTNMKFEPDNVEYHANGVWLIFIKGKYKVFVPYCNISSICEE